MRQSISRAIAVPIGESEWRVLGAVLDLVTSWSRLEDRVFVGALAEKAQLSERRTRDRLVHLDELGVIVWKPKQGGSGPGARSVVGLPRAESQPDTQERPVHEDAQPDTHRRPVQEGGAKRSTGRIRGSQPDTHERPETEKDRGLTTRPNGRGNDGLWNAFTEELGEVVTTSERGRRNKALKELRRIGATPDDVRHQCQSYRARWPEIDITETAVVANWSLLRRSVPPGRFVTADEIFREAAAMREQEGSSETNTFGNLFRRDHIDVPPEDIIEDAELA
jgi:hypothetical protein